MYLIFSILVIVIIACKPFIWFKGFIVSYILKPILAAAIIGLLATLIINNLLGLQLPFEKIFGAITNITMEEMKEASKFETANASPLLEKEEKILFPLRKCIKARFIHSLKNLSIKKPLLYAHYLIMSNLSYKEDGEITYWKDVYCVVKNLYDAPIVLKKVEKIDFKKNGKPYHDRSDAMEDLKNEINDELSKIPIVLYPNMEMPLFAMRRSLGNINFTLELEVDFIELSDEERVFGLTQEDIAPISRNSFKTSNFMHSKTLKHSITIR